MAKMSELNETYNFDDNKALAGENDVARPVYDSSDGPMPKGRQNQVPARGKADVFVSGESFGG